MAVGIAQNVGIGTLTPAYPLTVVAQSNKGIVQKNETVEIGFFTSANGAYLQTWSNHNLNFATNNGLAQMTITTTGNVGIGTAVPTARLDVAGGIRIRGGNPVAGYVLTATDNLGNAEWKPSPASPTKVLYIAHPAFLPDRSAIGHATVAPGVARRPNTTNTGLHKMLAPLLLPVGAVIKEMVWHYSDFSETLNMTMSLVREGSGDPAYLSQVTSTGSLNMARTLTVPLNLTVTGQSHWLEVSVQDWPNSFAMLIYGVKITYEY